MYDDKYTQVLKGDLEASILRRVGKNKGVVIVKEGHIWPTNCGKCGDLWGNVVFVNGVAVWSNIEETFDSPQNQADLEDWFDYDH